MVKDTFAINRDRQRRGGRENSWQRWHKQRPEGWEIRNPGEEKSGQTVTVKTGRKCWSDLTDGGCIQGKKSVERQQAKSKLGTDYG